MIARYILRLLGLYQLGLGAWFALVRPPLLPEDLRFVRSPDIELLAWLNLVFNVMGGQMAALGFALLLVSRCNFERFGKLDWLMLVGVGAASATLMAYANFALASDFRWLLLAPVALWLALAGLAISNRRAR